MIILFVVERYINLLTNCHQWICVYMLKGASTKIICFALLALNKLQIKYLISNTQLLVYIQFHHTEFLITYIHIENICKLQTFNYKVSITMYKHGYYSYTDIHHNSWRLNIKIGKC